MISGVSYMKILNGIDETFTYLSELRKSQVVLIQFPNFDFLKDVYDKALNKRLDRELREVDDLKTRVELQIKSVTNNVRCQ